MSVYDRSSKRLMLATFAGTPLLAGVSGYAAVPVPTPTVPAARHTAPPAAAVGRTTTIPVEFDLPPGHALVGFPRLRVVNAKGRLIELRPVYITQKPPAGRGMRSINSGSYPPGAYLLRVEMNFKDASGKAGTVVSPFSTLVVPKR